MCASPARIPKLDTPRRVHGLIVPRTGCRLLPWPKRMPSGGWMEIGDSSCNPKEAPHGGRMQHTLCISAFLAVACVSSCRSCVCESFYPSLTWDYLGTRSPPHATGGLIYVHVSDFTTTVLPRQTRLHNCKLPASAKGGRSTRHAVNMTEFRRNRLALAIPIILACHAAQAAS